MVLTARSGPQINDNKPRQGQPYGFVERVLIYIAEAWRTQRGRVLNYLGHTSSSDTNCFSKSQFQLILRTLLDPLLNLYNIFIGKRIFSVWHAD